MIRNEKAKTELSIAGWRWGGEEGGGKEKYKNKRKSITLKFDRS